MLSSTKVLLDSFRISEIEREINEDGRDQSPWLHLRAGILRISKIIASGDDGRFSSVDDSALIGLSTFTLKQLSVTSGSLVIRKKCQIDFSRN